jgi:2-oxoisovalerate ferredoxin oxidoreductase beta subunit
VNNAIYGMTGGQMAPTTLVGQKSTTTPWGRRPSNEGYPMKMCELISTLHAPIYVARTSLHDGKNVMKTRKAIQKAIKLQKEGAGFTFVEILSPCPTVWKMDPIEARHFIEEKMLPAFPLGTFKDVKPEAVVDEPIPLESMEQVLGLHGADGEAIAPTGPRTKQSRGLTLKIAGFGGQGILLLGQILAEIGMREGFEVSWLPSYGPEMRSGSANCHVSILPERVGSPLVSRPGALIAMNEPSLKKFGPTVAADGVILYNSDHVPGDYPPGGARVICIPASGIADGLGSTKVANVVMLGALLEATALLTPTRAMEVLTDKITRPDLLEMDRKALDAGAAFVREEVPTAAG